jgi:hypothetical protein
MVRDAFWSDGRNIDVFNDSLLNEPRLFQEIYLLDVDSVELKNCGDLCDAFYEEFEMSGKCCT